MSEEENTEPEVEETPAPEAADSAPAAAPEADAEPVETLHPKERRKLARSKHTGEVNPSRSAEERAAERKETRAKNAASRSRYRAKQREAKGEAGVGTPPATPEPGNQKVRQGIVTSAKANKTITVSIGSANRHPSYEKIVRRSKSLHVHDENNEAGEGDTVRVIETRPMSKTKRWRLVEVVEKAK